MKELSNFKNTLFNNSDNLDKTSEYLTFLKLNFKT